MRNRGTLALVLIILLLSLPLSNTVEAAAGDLDASFGNAGKVITDFFGNSDEAHAIAIQTDGRIVVAGTSRDISIPEQTTRFAIARYNQGGSSDNSFGVDGKVITD